MPQPLMLDVKTPQIINRLPPPIPRLSYPPRVLHPSPFYSPVLQRLHKKHYNKTETKIYHGRRRRQRRVSKVTPPTSEGLEE